MSDEVTDEVPAVEQDQALYSQRAFAERVYSAATGTERRLHPGATWDQFTRFCDAALAAVRTLGERVDPNFYDLSGSGADIEAVR